MGEKVFPIVMGEVPGGSYAGCDIIVLSDENIKDLANGKYLELMVAEEYTTLIKYESKLKLAIESLDRKE